MWRYAITRSYSIVLSKTKSWRKKIEEEKYTESIVEISNDRVTFARLFYYTFLFLPPPILKSFRAMSSRLKNGIPVDKKIFSTRYQRRGILDVGWQRSHGALNIFSVCLSRAKISRSSRRDLPQKKKKKNSSSPLAFPSLFFPAPFFFFSPSPPRSPAAFPFRRVQENFDGDSCLRPTSAPVIPIFHTAEEASSWLRAKRRTNRPESSAKNDKSVRWTSTICRI